MKADIKDINIEATRLVEISGYHFSEIQIDVIRELETAMDNFKLFNKFARIAILSVVMKESGFVIKSETPYRRTSNPRIRSIFTSRVAMYNDAQLTELKSSDYNFFNAVYGNMYGNDPDEGYKYRGKGLNQLTFKSNYAKINTIIAKFIKNIDIVLYPELVLKSKRIASICCIAYFIDRFENVATFDFNTLEDAILMIFKANAGWGKDITDSGHQETLQKTRDYSQYFNY